MKIIVIGGNGTLGTAVSAELSPRHEIVAVGRKGGDFQANMREIDSPEIRIRKDREGGRDRLYRGKRALRIVGGNDARKV